MITADTITDAQIRALREPASEYGEGCYDGIAGSGRWMMAAEVIDLCDTALGDLARADDRWVRPNDGKFADQRREARARCAEIINARTVKP